MYKLLFVIILAFISCSENKSESILDKEKIQNAELDDESMTIRDDSEVNDNSEQAKRWLETAIKEYFDQELNDWSFMTTDEYYEYKIDMINSVYAHGIAIDSLEKKWSYKYEVSEKKTGVGFLIGAQDYYNVVIQTCSTLPSIKKGNYLFKLVLCDTGYDQCFESDVTVIEYNNSYAIDDVKEYYR
ncbi:MAG: hypothetical protein ACFHU9_03675 [Fluviicola sp.]